MNKGMLIKIVVAGVGLYIVYQFAKSRGWIGGQAQLPAGAGAGSGTGAGAGAGAGTVTAGTGTGAGAGTGTGAAVPPPPTAVNTNPALAAKEPAYAATSTLLFTPDEWNYYRTQQGLSIRDALEYPGVTPENRGSVKISGSQYHAWVGQAPGLSGLRGFWGANPGIGGLFQ